MSEARKCDRCHGYFELSEEEQKDRRLPYDMKGTYVKIMLFGRYGEVENSVRRFDLCPKCVELLDKWLENPDSWKPEDCLTYIGDGSNVDRSNGATEKELELASKLNDAKIYIAQLKSELGYTMTKEEIEFMKDIHNFTDEDISEAAKFVETKSSEAVKLNEYGCPHDKCCDCPHFSKEPNPFNVHDHKGIYKCNDKNIYISGNCSRPDVSDMTPNDFCNLGCNFVKEITEESEYKDPCKSCHNGVCEQCDYGYISEEEKKKRWLERNKKEVKLSDPYEDGGL